MKKDPIIIRSDRNSALAYYIAFFLLSLYGIYSLFAHPAADLFIFILKVIFSPLGFLVSIIGFYTIFSSKFVYKQSVEGERDFEPFITITADEVICNYPSSGKTDRIKWEDITLIQVLTTDQGPELCDVFYMLTGKDDKGVAIPQDKKESKGVFEIIRKFPGFDNETFIKAMGSSQVHWFTVWKKEA